jgi:hypothetical protein
MHRKKLPTKYNHIDFRFLSAILVARRMQSVLGI